MISQKNRSENSIKPKKWQGNPHWSLDAIRNKRHQSSQCPIDSETQIEEAFAAFEYTTDTIITVDSSRRIQTINHPPVGLNIREMIGTDVIDYIGHQYQGMVRKMIDGVFATGVPGTYEIKDGGLDKTISCYETRLTRFGGDNSTHRVLLITRDITRQKELEKRTRQHNKAESLSCMAGAIAHQYNNMLAVILGNLDLALENLPVDSKHTYVIWQAMLAANRGSKLGRLILASLGQAACRYELLDLAEVCHHNIPSLKADIAKNVILEVSLPSHVLPIMANTDQIKQILDILIVNAREAIGDLSGTVFLSIKSVSPANIDFNHRVPVAFQPGEVGYACLTVRDEGGGIAEQDIEKIFDHFYSTKFISRGMGLSVARGIVAALGGCITVESELASGSVFRVYLPLTTEAIAGHR